MTATSTISLQPATHADDAVLRMLSQLDSAPTLRRPALLAVVDGRPVAAASLSDGRVVADPFVDSAGAVALLRVSGSATVTPLRGGRRLPRLPRLPRLRPAI